MSMKVNPADPVTVPSVGTLQLESDLGDPFVLVVQYGGILR